MEHKHHSSMTAAEATSALATDPVCRMSVDPATAKHKAEHGGETFFFCSAGCRGKFVAEPAKYLGTVGRVRARAGRAHRPGLQPQNPAAGTIYTCPMHPQIRQGHPGNCPICGIALEPEVAAEQTGPGADLLHRT